MIQRRMRFQTMGKVEIPTYFILHADKDEKNAYFTIEATAEEKEMLDAFLKKKKENIEKGLEPTADISRVQLNTVNKLIEPFENYANAFIDMQNGKGNSPITIKHYQQTIKKLEYFFAYKWCVQRNLDYSVVTKDEKLYIGSKIPYGILEETSFEAQFREFLLEVENVSLQTVSTYFRDYRVIAYWGMDEGLIRKKAITVKTVEADIKDCYTDSEIDKLLKKPADDCDFSEYRDWVVINYVLGTGNRISTITNLKIKDIDFDDNMISINTQKNKRKVRLPLELKLSRILKEYIDEWLTDEDGHYITEYLFPSVYTEDNTAISREALSKSIAKYNKSRGVSKTSMHLFRHTFAKNWIIKGGDLHSLQRVLGHSTLEMVTHYANLYSTDLKPKMENYSILTTHKSKNKGKKITRRNR